MGVDDLYSDRRRWTVSDDFFGTHNRLVVGSIPLQQMTMVLGAGPGTRLPAMNDVTVRPSRAAYETSWPQRKRQALGFGGGAVVVFFVIVLVGILRQPSNALLILLLLGLAGLAVVGVFAIEFAYLRNATITVISSSLRLTGVPFDRSRTSPAPASFQRATVDFGRGVKRRAWIALDASGKQLFWTYADFWDERAIDELASATGAIVSGAWTTVTVKPAVARW